MRHYSLMYLDVYVVPQPYNEFVTQNYKLISAQNIPSMASTNSLHYETISCYYDVMNMDPEINFITLHQYNMVLIYN